MTVQIGAIVVAVLFIFWAWMAFNTRKVARSVTKLKYEANRLYDSAKMLNDEYGRALARIRAEGAALVDCNCPQHLLSDVTGFHAVKQFHRAPNDKHNGSDVPLWNAEGKPQNPYTATDSD